MLQTETGLYGNYELVQLMSVYNGIIKGVFTDFKQLRAFLAQSFFHYRAFLEIMLIQYVFASKAEIDRVIKGFHNKYGNIVNANGKVNYISYNINIDTSFNKDATEFLNRFELYCIHHGVQLYVNFPATAKQAIGIQVQDSLFIKHFSNSFNIPHLNSPSDAIADKNHFFDSPYHLRTEWQKKHTEKLCWQLTKELRK